MTIERLEEIAAWAESTIPLLEGSCLADAIPYYTDLARCARAWAALEKAMHAEHCPVELYGYHPQLHPWSWYRGVGLTRKRSAGETAIEAVEAAGGGE